MTPNWCDECFGNTLVSFKDVIHSFKVDNILMLELKSQEEDNNALSKLVKYASKKITMIKDEITFPW